MRACPAIALLVAGALQGTAHADPAGDLFVKGQAQYNAGNFRAAIKLFEEAYGLVKDPVYLFNIAQSHRKLYNCVHATTYYERFLAEATDLDPKARVQVTEWLAELRPCVEERQREQQRQRDGGPVASLPEPAFPTADYRTRDRGRRYRYAGLAIGGVGVAAAIVAVVYGKRAGDISDELAAACADGCEWTPEREAREQDGERASLVSTIGWIGGGAAIAGGVALYLYGRSRGTEQILVLPTRDGAAVSATFRF